jgi:hypothetical protein
VIDGCTGMAPKETEVLRRKYEKMMTTSFTKELDLALTHLSKLDDLKSCESQPRAHVKRKVTFHTLDDSDIDI